MKSLQKSIRFLIRFLIDAGSILDPTGSPKIEHVSLFFTLGATLGPSWRPKCSKTAPELDLPPKMYHFGVNIRKISQDFEAYFLYNSLLNFQFHVLFSMIFQQGCFNLQLCFSSRRFGTVAAWRAQRTGYIRRPLATGVTRSRLF